MSILAILIGLPLSIVGAASQSYIIGVLFGLMLASGIDALIENHLRKKTI